MADGDTTQLLESVRREIAARGAEVQALSAGSAHGMQLVDVHAIVVWTELTAEIWAEAATHDKVLAEVVEQLDAMLEATRQANAGR